jgi:hypothetical protein
VCNGFGDPQYVTFDHSNYTFNGNCTYIAARDVNPQGNHTFQVGSLNCLVVFRVYVMESIYALFLEIKLNTDKK